ncbi:hypothetical protein PanWU01x14_262610 [Parasponia andersonii]|uniref:Uncharacterized protein n=1 Tax=Parasponia andersonii TaxID=3476 RepID=A0A2P5B857_PARAD|nr:hypothetical protein PanWU01x14_262610 [Parasponia andersonii]
MQGRSRLKLEAFRDSKDTWTVGGYNVSSSETRGQLVKTIPTVWRCLWERYRTRIGLGRIHPRNGMGSALALDSHVRLA